MLITTAATVFAVDHVIKRLVVAGLTLGDQWPASGPVVVHHIRNSGAAFGLFPRMQILFLVVAVVVSGYILLAGHRFGGGPLTRVVLGAILGGAIANGVDRYGQGFVVDYVDVHWWPIFNFADSCIVVGILVAVLTLGRRPRPSGRSADHPIGGRGA